MNRSSAEVTAEFPERGLHWVKEQVETTLSETEDYVRERPCGRVRFEPAAAGSNCGRTLSIARRGIKACDSDLRRREALSGGAGRKMMP